MLLSIPTNVRITYTPGNDYALLEWDAPTSRGSSAITGYVLTRDDGGGADPGPWSYTYSDASMRQLTFISLKTGTYTLSVAAQNNEGTGLVASMKVQIRVP